MTAEQSARGLREYRAKRDFRRTPEPTPEQSSPRKRAKRSSASGPVPTGRARFVVHEHHARRLHWDLRLERDGALLSWAIPNGIPQDPKENRKAVHVEDHPLSYIDFEGEIPAGSYGAGQVSIWDHGEYDCEKLQEDKLVVVFHGERLQGRYALFRTGAERDWMIHRMDPPTHPREPMPEHLPPMLASPGRLPADDDAGRSRSSGTACARSPTGVLGGCASRAATSTTSAPVTRSCGRWGVSSAPARRARRRDRRLRRAGGAELRAAAAPDAPDLGQRDPPARARGAGHLRDLRLALPRRVNARSNCPTTSVERSSSSSIATVRPGRPRPTIAAGGLTSWP